MLMKSKGDKPIELKSEKKSPAPKAGGAWNSALIQYCTHPENFPDQIYFSNDKVVAMYGKYTSYLYLCEIPNGCLRRVSESQNSHASNAEAVNTDICRFE